MDSSKVVIDLPTTPESVVYSASQSSSPSAGASGDEMSDTSSIAPPGSINADNYITVTEGCQSVLTESELTECVNKCKDMVLETEECSDERKWLVRRLIELRHRLQQLVESQSENSLKIGECVLHGHHFNQVYEPTSTTKKYCDRCCGTIWHLVQAWYQCVDCQYKCHVSCLSKTIRTCAHLILSETPYFEPRICPEIGLSAQRYSCHECQAHISFSLPKGAYTISNPFYLASGLVEARRCDYTGLYYCPSCHWNSISVIPARAVNNWDFEPRLVCRASYQIIRLARSRPIITLESRLFALIANLSIIKRKREEMSLMKQYIASCRVALESKFLMKELEWRRHLIHNTDIYSLDDLIDINSGKLIRKIDEIHNKLRCHITQECKVCQGRGFFCEKCDVKEVFFPFDVNAYVCPKCSSVQHKSCWIKKQNCPKCERTDKRNKTKLVTQSSVTSS